MVANTPAWHDLNYWIEGAPFVERTLFALVRLTMPEPLVVENDDRAILNEGRYEV